MLKYAYAIIGYIWWITDLADLSYWVWVQLEGLGLKHFFYFSNASNDDRLLPSQNISIILQEMLYVGNYELDNFSWPSLYWAVGADS